MKKIGNIQNLITEKRWTGTVCFYMMLVMTFASLVFIQLHGVKELAELTWLSLGADLVSMAICTVLLYSLKQIRGNSRGESGVFVMLVTMVGWMVFTDIANWVVQGSPRLRVWNIIVNVANYESAVLLIYYFWRYMALQLELQGKAVKILDRVMNILLIPVSLAILANLFWPLYFTVDDAGYYARTDLYMISHLFTFVAVIAGGIGFIISKVPIRVKLISASFIIIPLISLVLTGGSYELTTEFSGMLISVVLIYAVLFADRGKQLISTEKELSIASQIQADMLPSLFPAFPEREEFEMFASMDPAKEVGGDFYDFFMIDDDHLAAVIADVSDKGVPAALFMMSSKIIINYRAQMGGTPGEILTAANAELCKNNRRKMFVTVWMGILELSTGKLTCTNAGHEYPMIRGKNGQFRVLEDKHGIAVGVVKKSRYTDYEIQLEPGDAVFVYTDGVPEAVNGKGEMYGMERTEATLNRFAMENPKGILEEIREDVRRFAGEAKQSDDLTMLCLEYKGKPEAK